MLNELHLPPAPGSEPDHFDVFQNYEIEAENRDALRVHLDGCGIGTILQWGGKATHQYPALQLRGSLPATDRVFSRCLMLPMNMMVSLSDVDYIADSVIGFFRR